MNKRDIYNKFYGRFLFNQRQGEIGEKKEDWNNFLSEINSFRSRGINSGLNLEIKLKGEKVKLNNLNLNEIVKQVKVFYPKLDYLSTMFQEYIGRDNPTSYYLDLYNVKPKGIFGEDIFKPCKGKRVGTISYEPLKSKKKEIKK